MPNNRKFGYLRMTRHMSVFPITSLDRPPTYHSRHLKSVSCHLPRPTTSLSVAPQVLRVRSQRPSCQRFALRPCAQRLVPDMQVRPTNFLSNSTRSSCTTMRRYSSRGISGRLTFVLMVVLESTGGACQGPGTCEVSPALTTTSPALSPTLPSPGWASNLLQSHSMMPGNECPCTLHNSRSKPCESHGT